MVFSTPKKLGEAQVIRGLSLAALLICLLKTSFADTRPTRDPIHDRWSLETWCSHLRSEIKKIGWPIEPCHGIPWEFHSTSVLGKPIPTARFGDPSAMNTTLVMGMIHGDENTPLYLVLQLARYLSDKEDLFKKNSIQVVVAPLINPDGFFRKTRTRTNAHRVDLNRNLPTRDWNTSAIHLWKTKFQANPRRFPGHEPLSEPETIFQKELLEKLRPQKILSIHAPLNFMDYDGPSTLQLSRFPQDYVKECIRLKAALKAVRGGFFPGSLGNFAGQELGIPTLTLELPSANIRKAEEYWNRFSEGIRTMIEFRLSEAESTKGKSVKPE